MNYLLTPEGVPVPEPDILKWARGFEKLDRRVGFERIGPYRVSTVFLGLDHGQNPSEPQVWVRLWPKPRHRWRKRRIVSSMNKYQMPSFRRERPCPRFDGPSMSPGATVAETSP